MDTVCHSAMVGVVIVGGWKYLKCLLSFGQRLKAYELQMGQVFVVPFDIIANNLRTQRQPHFGGKRGRLPSTLSDTNIPLFLPASCLTCAEKMEKWCRNVFVFPGGGCSGSSV